MPISLNSQNIYEIKVYGQLDEPWLGSIGAAETYTAILDDNSQVTTISNVILDQVHKTVKTHSLNGRCRTVGEGMSAGIRIVP